MRKHDENTAWFLQLQRDSEHSTSVFSQCREKHPSTFSLGEEMSVTTQPCKETTGDGVMAMVVQPSRNY